RVPGRGAAAGTPLRGGVRRLRGDRGAQRVVRGDGPRRVPAPAARGRRGGRAHLRAQRTAGRRARRHRRGRPLPAPGHVPPELPRPADAAARRPAAAPAARGGRHRPGRPARRRTVLRLRRHVRGEERRRLRRDARRQVRPGRRNRRRVRGRRGQLVPRAHRWRTRPPGCPRPRHPLRRDPGGYAVSDPLVGDLPFPRAARTALGDRQLRANLRMATGTIRAKRAAVVSEMDDWEELRAAGAAIKADVLARLPDLLVEFEAAATAAGARVHWARDAAEACAIVADLVRETGETEVVKVKSMATQEIGLNEALAAVGVDAVETDLAELIVQLADDKPSHILVPAIHYNRTQIRD